MLVENLYVQGTATWLPGPATGATLEVDDTGQVGKTGTGQLWTENRLSAAEMAVEAVKELPKNSESSGPIQETLIHASTYHQGQDLSPLASIIQGQARTGSGQSFEIKQMSNGGLCAMHLASCINAAHPDLEQSFVLSASERYTLPGIDRWKTDPGTPYGDGAAAILLSSRPGSIRVANVVLSADSSLYGLHQSNPVHTTAPFVNGGYVEFLSSKNLFMETNSLSSVISRVSAGQTAVITEALQETNLSIEEIDHFVIPHFGKRRIESIYTPLGIAIEKTQFDWSKNIGHLGAADQFAGLDHLINSGKLEAGQKVMLLSVGAGYTWGSSVLEIQ